MDQWDDKTITECPKCEQPFNMRDLSQDPSLIPKGMRFADDGGDRNEFHFEHRTPTCNETFSVSVMHFAPAVMETLSREVPLGTGNCQRHCFDINDLAVCNHDCLYAPFRRYLLSLKEAKQVAKAD